MGAGLTRLLTLPVIFLPEALGQIEDIGSYIAEHGSSARARAFTTRLTTRCHAIGGMPFGGTPRDELGPELRSIPFEQAATIFYRVTNAEVLVVAVLYRGRDQISYFGRSR